MSKNAVLVSVHITLVIIYSQRFWCQVSLYNSLFFALLYMPFSLSKSCKWICRSKPIISTTYRCQQATTFSLVQYSIAVILTYPRFICNFILEFRYGFVAMKRMSNDIINILLDLHGHSIVLLLNAIITYLEFNITFHERKPKCTMEGKKKNV